LGLFSRALLGFVFWVMVFWLDPQLCGALRQGFDHEDELAVE
jgi:hypothetical protein